MRVKVDNCPAGPEMDAACAEAMGHKVYCDARDGRYFIASSQEAFERARDQEIVFFESSPDKSLVYCQEMKKPSTRIEHAWELVEHILGLVGTPEDKLDKRNVVNKFYHYMVASSLLICMLSQEAALTISRAFLKAKGIEFVGVPDKVVE